MNPFRKWRLAEEDETVRQQHGETAAASLAFWRDRASLEAHVERELRRALPSGWRVIRRDPKRLNWTVEKVAGVPGEWDMQDYGLHVSTDLEWIIVTHGNNDIGINPYGAIQTAKVIAARDVDGGNTELAACLQFIFEHCHPNEWGYT